MSTLRHRELAAAIAARLERGQRLVLVSVMHTAGSAPREAGAVMLVAEPADCAVLGSIGGGHLEWRAVLRARELLAEGGRIDSLQLALGPSLGQCCGGVVRLLLESFEPGECALWRAHARGLEQGQWLLRELAEGEPASRWRLVAPGAGAPRCRFEQLGARWQHAQAFADDAPRLQLFGGGHVGAALVQVLAPLDIDITWVDTRDEVFPQQLPANVLAEQWDEPAEAVALAPPGAWFLVMTHRHDLDFALCRAIFARRDWRFFGLIGSRSKRAAFERRLQQHGVDPARLAEMSCPIGAPGISAKDPASIAIAIAAQLLQVRDAAAAVARLDGRTAGVREQPEA